MPASSWNVRTWCAAPTGVVAALLFLLTFTVYRISPVAGMADSHYTMLFAQNLWEHGRLDASTYFQPPLDPRQYPGLETYGRANKGIPHHTYEFEGGVYAHFPPGNFVLSGPFALLHHLFGISTIMPDRGYDWHAEVIMQRNTAATVTAGTAVLLFLLARCWLAVPMSSLLALAAAFGTSLYSTASRVMWSHTWGVFLLSAALLLVARAVRHDRPLRPILLGTLLALLFIVRPVFALSTGTIALFVLVRRPQDVIRMMVAGMAWAAALAWVDLATAGQVLPEYFNTTSGSVGSAQGAWAGSLFSPSRGLLVFSPILLVSAGLLLTRGWRLRTDPLFVMALAGTGLHLILLGNTSCWYAGHCYGPRYATDAIPWLFLMTAILLAPRSGAPATNPLLRGAGTALTTFLLLISFFMHAWGSCMPQTWTWNSEPANIDAIPGRVWDWRHPQFLAGLFTPEALPPSDAPAIRRGKAGRLRAGDPGTDTHFIAGYGWSSAEGRARWTSSREPRLFFRAPRGSNLVLRLRASPFLSPPLAANQTVDVMWNHNLVTRWSFAAPQAQTVTAHLPAASCDICELRLRIPHATSPRAAGVSDDPRLLGLYVEWLQFD